MKIVLTSLNSKYIHTNLAIRSIKSNLDFDQGEVILREFTINDNLESVLSKLAEEKADVYAFSVYIWNSEKTAKLTRNLKKIMPESIIVAGGPEVSFESEAQIKSYNLDFIVRGEGEAAFRRLIYALKSGSDISMLPSITYRKSDEIISTKDGFDLLDMDGLEDAYPCEELENLDGRIIYYEGSRGCPFACAYCMSSVEKSMRFRSIEKVKVDVGRFIELGVGQVKFVDRTFNCNKERSKEILRYIVQNNQRTNFHFEIAADLLDEETIDILSKSPPGLIQLEVGVQSVHEKTLKEINRKTDIKKIKENAKKILRLQNIHMHLDLIAGLPFETIDDFAISFNEIIELKPHMLQLGFLKILKGSPMTNLLDKHGYKHRDYPPYQVLKNSYLSYSDISILEKVEHVVDKYYNSGSFKYTLDMVLDMEMDTMFEFFRQLADYWDANGYFDNGVSKDKAYEILMGFLLEKEFDGQLVENLVKMDYLISNKWPLAKFLPHESPGKEEAFEMLKDEAFVKKHLPAYWGAPAKEIYKKVYFESFSMPRGEKKTAIFYKPEHMLVKSLNAMTWIDEDIDS